MGRFVCDECIVNGKVRSQICPVRVAWAKVTRKRKGEKMIVSNYTVGCIARAEVVSNK